MEFAAGFVDGGCTWIACPQVFYIVSMLLKIKFLACCSNIWAWILLLIVCLSAALHGTMAFLFADICYEFDLHLATYYLPESPKFAGYENLNFLPPEAAGFCGPDGSLAFMKGQFDAQLDASIQMAFDIVRDTCNDPTMTAFMDCSGVAILTACSIANNPCQAGDDNIVPVVGYQSKTVKCPDDAVNDDTCGWGYWNSQLATVPSTLMIRNADPDNMPEEILGCVAQSGVDDGTEACSHAVTTWSAVFNDPACESAVLDGNEATCTSAGSCTYTAATGDTGEACAPQATADVIVTRGADCVAACTTATGSACSADAYTPPIDPAAIDPVALGPAIRQCFVDNEPPMGTNCAGTCAKLSFEDCATQCTNADARASSAEVVNGITESTQMVADLRQLLDDEAMPFLKCSFVSEIFADLFVPLCVDAFGGFSMISAGNVVSIIALIISFPVGVMATKRLVKSKISPELSYAGSADGQNDTANAQPTGSYPVTETTQLM